MAGDRRCCGSVVNKVYTRGLRKHRMRLLIIEDGKPLAQVLKKGFEEQGYSVELTFAG